MRLIHILYRFVLPAIFAAFQFAETLIRPAYVQVIAQTGTSASATAMFEDSLRNLRQVFLSNVQLTSSFQHERYEKACIYVNVDAHSFTCKTVM